MKGKGKTHAKWSPVGTTWYELCPEVVLLRNVSGRDAEDFIAAVHPPGWETHRPPGSPEGPQTCYAIEGGVLRVANSRGCWYCLERVRRLSGDPRWEGAVQLRRIKEHYLFTLESCGQLPPEALFNDAVAILREKCHRLLGQL